MGSLYETARNFPKAVDYFGKAAQHSAGVFAFLEAVVLASRGLKLLDTLPESQERDRQELALQAYLGGALSATRGYADQGSGQAYSKVYELSKKLEIDTQTAIYVAGLIPFLEVMVPNPLDGESYAVRIPLLDDFPLHIPYEYFLVFKSF